MPLTLAHPLAVVPFFRWLPPAALIAGAVAPDSVYYVPIPLTGSATHSACGVLSWNVLLGLALLAAFRLSAEPATALTSFRVPLRPLPEHRKDRTGRRTPAPSGAAPAVSPCTIGAIVIGASTHVLWDFCTQTAGFAVQHWEVLRLPVIEPHKVYNVLGYVSSVVGTVAFGVVIWRRAERVPSMLPPLWRSTIVTVLLGVALLGALLAVTDPLAHPSPYDLVRLVIISAAECLLCAWVGYVTLWWVARLGRRWRAGHQRIAGIRLPHPLRPGFRSWRRVRRR
ncbi:DUF4184 family protein [Nocardia sp. NPDC050378]|uniref:DUF4184 family protein n=1 Tax=Nocardia sp. NPDC050378 TaxID=3155400 RepID=UPI0033E0F258